MLRCRVWALHVVMDVVILVASCCYVVAVVTGHTLTPTLPPCEHTASYLGERRALRTLHDDTRGLYWTKGWPNVNVDASDHCQWYGVVCSLPSCAVTALKLGGNALHGVIPAELSTLVNLQVLDLSKNKLKGSLPVELSQLHALRALSVERNTIEGRLPPELAQLENLETLNVNNNRIEGPLASAFVQMRSLKSLRVYSNNLSGVFPPIDKALMKNLTELQLSDNGFWGPVPDINGLTSLQIFDCRRNNFTSLLPDFERLPKLIRFDASYNRLSGPLPHLAGAPVISFFGVHDNALEDTISSLSSKLCEVKQGFIANVSNNRITGNLSGASKCVLLALFAKNTGISGEIPSFLMNYNVLNLNDNIGIVGSVHFANTTRLVTMALSGTGITSITIDSPYRNLKHLMIRSTRILTLDIAKFPSLMYFDAGGISAWQGKSIPADLRTLRKLQTIILDDCGLVGLLSPVNVFPNLVMLDLSVNTLTGPLLPFQSPLLQYL